MVRPGDNIAELLVNAIRESRIVIQEGDVLVVTQKIVSKAEGRIIKSSDVEVTDRAAQIAKRNNFDPVQVELALRESRNIIRAERVLITETKNGQICNFSGVDKSNTEPETYVLLPEDPDLSAQTIRDGIRGLLGIDVGVVISDSQGRPWRKGSVGVAIGTDGLNAFKHNKGKRDLFGRVLEQSMVCQADELASAAEPVIGQSAEGIPAAVIRGYRYASGNEKARDIARPPEEDLFR